MDITVFDRELDPLIREDKVGVEVGFIRRKPRKIHPLHLLKAFCILLPQGPSLRTLAMVLSVLCAEAVSKQAVAKRIGKSWVEFLKQILALLLCRQLGTASAESLFAEFNRVLLHDSSTLPLPQALASYYPGTSSVVTHRRRYRRSWTLQADPMCISHLLHLPVTTRLPLPMSSVFYKPVIWSSEISAILP